jgi:hypothetical protein
MGLTDMSVAISETAWICGFIREDAEAEGLRDEPSRSVWLSNRMGTRGGELAGSMWNEETGGMWTKSMADESFTALLALEVLN